MIAPRAAFVFACAAVSGCGLVWGITDLTVADGHASDASSDAPFEDAPRDAPSSAVARSCQGLARSCGGSGDCCESPVVEGGTFYRSYDGVGYTSKEGPATVTSFRLDRYEITVGRFRAFLADYPFVPAPGSGKNPRDPSDRGWDPAFAAHLPADAATLSAALVCNSQASWTAQAGASEDVALSCMTWFEAFAFCIWDGARLATEAEWNYAAAAGAEQRAYPWSNPPSSSSIDHQHAVYGGLPAIARVGSLPAGDGRWGQSDLAGNVWEWARDGYDDVYPTPCTDCIDDTDAARRSTRGGCFGCPASDLFTAYRGATTPDTRRVDIGSRCARDL